MDFPGKGSSVQISMSQDFLHWCHWCHHGATMVPPLVPPCCHHFALCSLFWGNRFLGNPATSLCWELQEWTGYTCEQTNILKSCGNEEISVGNKQSIFLIIPTVQPSTRTEWFGRRRSRWQQRQRGPGINTSDKDKNKDRGKDKEGLVGWIHLLYWKTKMKKKTKTTRTWLF